MGRYLKDGLHVLAAKGKFIILQGMQKAQEVQLHYALNVNREYDLDHSPLSDQTHLILPFEVVALRMQEKNTSSHPILQRFSID